jgi:hypothetical protein
VNIWINAPYGTAPYAFTMTAAGATVWSESSSNTHVALPWVTTSTPDGPQTLTVTVRDAAGKTGSSSVSVIVQNGTSSPPPGSALTASFSSPADGATVTGTVTVGMAASGGTAPYTYTLQIDGTQVFTTTTSALTASTSWNTTTYSNASHTLRLTVRDAAGTSATASRSVTVSNGSTGSPLSMALTSPTPGETVSGMEWANIWVNTAGTPPYSYTLSVGSTVLWQESSSNTHVTLPWDTTQLANGTQTFTTTVRDAAGRTGSASVSVVVQN